MKRQLIAINSVLQQREEREDMTKEYCMHLETAIREQNLFPAITLRVNELMGDRPVDRSGKPDFNMQIELDAVRRDLEITKMTLTETETENKNL